MHIFFYSVTQHFQRTKNTSLLFFRGVIKLLRLFLSQPNWFKFDSTFILPLLFGKGQCCPKIPIFCMCLATMLLFSPLGCIPNQVEKSVLVLLFSFSQHLLHTRNIFFITCAMIFSSSLKHCARASTCMYLVTTENKNNFLMKAGVHSPNVLGFGSIKEFSLS